MYAVKSGFELFTQNYCSPPTLVAQLILTIYISSLFFILRAKSHGAFRATAEAALALMNSRRFIFRIVSPIFFDSQVIIRFQ
jgi:hypothetical protein